MLEVLAFQYTQLPEPGTFVVSFLAIVIGAVLAASLMAPPEGLLSRSYYFQRIGIASLALVAVQAAWLWYPTALAYGVSWLMLASDLLSALAYGAYMIRIAQARSRDAYGHTGRAWFALVPLVNLVLLFKPSQSPDAAPGSTGAALVGLGLIILSRLAVPVLLNAVELRTVAGMQDPEIQAAATALRVRALGTAAALDILIVAEGAPAEIQTGLTLTAVTRSDLHLTYEFSLDQTDAEVLVDDYRAEVTSSFCSGLMLYLTAGASATLHYTRSDGHELARIELSLAECTA